MEESDQEGVENGSIDLTWTSPGDDNDIGKVNNYVVKYSTAKIVEATWNTSYTYTFGQSWIPQSAGNLEENTITGLIPGAKYYVAIKSQDEVPNTSEISNSPLAFAQVMILSVSVIQPSHDFGIISVSTMVVIYSSTTVINDGNVPVTYSLHCSSSVPTNWAPVSTAPSNNAQFRLLGIFNGSVKPSSAEFNSLDDYLTLTPRAATSDIFSNNETGDNVSINTIRGLWFRIETPLPNPVSTQQTITVTITAEQP